MIIWNSCMKSVRKCVETYVFVERSMWVRRNHVCRRIGNKVSILLSRSISMRYTQSFSPGSSQIIWLTRISLFLSGSYETVPHRSNGNQITRKKQRGIYSCTNTNCLRSFNWKGNLMRHLRYECGLQPRFKCPYCDYCCKVKGDVGKHIVRKHKDAAVYVLDLGPWFVPENVNCPEQNRNNETYFVTLTTIRRIDVSCTMLRRNVNIND